MVQKSYPLEYPLAESQDRKNIHVLPHLENQMKNEQGIVDSAGDCVGGSGGYLTNNVWSGTEVI